MIRHRSPFSGALALILSAATIAVTSGQQSWTASNLSEAGAIYGLAHGAGEFVAVAADGAIARSADGASWTPSRAPDGMALQSVAHGRGGFVAVGEGGRIFRSADLVSWTADVAVPSTAYLDAVTSYGKDWIAVGGGGTVLLDQDGAGWLSVTSGTSAFLSGVVANGGRAVAVGSSGAALYSDDLLTWTLATSGTTRFLSDICESNGRFVAVGQTGTILFSDDGANWTAASSGTSSWLFDVESGNGDFVAVGENGTILRSGDGENWTSVSAPAVGFLSGAYRGGTFIAGTDAGKSYHSAATPATIEIEFGSSEVTLAEGTSAFAVSVTRGSSAGAASIEIQLVERGASTGTDFSVSPLTLQFADGQSAAQTLLDIVDDGLLEGFEEVIFELRNPSAGHSLGSSSSLCVRIHDAGDTDGDLLPDAWELVHFATLATSSAGDDPDGDGNDNRREFEDGTDPKSPASANYAVTASGFGATYFKFPDQAFYAPDDFVAVGATDLPGYTFMHWLGPVLGDPSDNPATVQVLGDTELIAVLGTSLDNALDDPGGSWATSGAAPWFGQTGTSSDGEDSAQSGELGVGGVSELSSTVAGPGIFRFSWRADFNAAGDLGRFTVDGQTRATVVSGAGWEEVDVPLSGGAHNIRFLFQRGASAPVGAMMWVDDVNLDTVAAPSYSSWAAANFGAAAGDPAVAAASADPDADSVPNAFEFLLDHDPLAANTAALLGQPIEPDGDFKVSLEVASDRLPAVTIALEESDDLQTWTATGVVLDETDVGGGRTLLAATLPVDVRDFYRFTVEVDDGF